MSTTYHLVVSLCQIPWSSVFLLFEHQGDKNIQQSAWNWLNTSSKGTIQMETSLHFSTDAVKKEGRDSAWEKELGTCLPLCRLSLSERLDL